MSHLQVGVICKYTLMIIDGPHLSIYCASHLFRCTSYHFQSVGSVHLQIVPFYLYTGSHHLWIVTAHLQVDRAYLYIGTASLQMGSGNLQQGRDCLTTFPVTIYRLLLHMIDSKLSLYRWKGPPIDNQSLSINIPCLFLHSVRWMMEACDVWLLSFCILTLTNIQTDMDHMQIITACLS